MFNNNNDKVTFRDLDERITSLRNWDLKSIEEDMKSLAQLVSMLISELGYEANMQRGSVVTLNKNKKKK
jgi:hypothetical protein